jgi:endonuclease/exonuclease/phosphatase family metal-dependent hydrolase
MEPGDRQREAPGARSQARSEDREEEDGIPASTKEDRHRARAKEDHRQEASRLRSLALLLVLLAACRTGRNYPDPAGPRYGGSAPVVQPPSAGETLKVVSFNIEYARETKRAIRIMQSVAVLRSADIVLLQEMTAPTTKMVADALGMHYVYYPAIYNRLVRHDFGNAVLSRWPIVEDAKLILPSKSRYAKTQRIATAATIDVAGRRVRVYSTHFGTPLDLGWEGRVAQLRFIIDDAARYPQVILGGDMNSGDIGRVAREAGYLWPTDTIRKSNAAGRLDHFFLRGFVPLDSAGAGTHYVPPVISDHSPIWIRVRGPSPIRRPSLSQPATALVRN